MLGSGAEANVSDVLRETQRAQQQRDGEGGKREENERDLRVTSGSGNDGGFSEMCDIDTARFERKVLFWQSVAIDKSKHNVIGECFVVRRRRFVQLRRSKRCVS